jgi:AcrR family transcriptional regulator
VARSPRERGPGPLQRTKSAHTRERVVNATLELISEVGLAGATTLRIADRSSVSWGGIQHQFGTKAHILNAVLDRVLQDFDEEVMRFSTRATTLEGRVRAWVAASWTLFQNPAYQAFREVMRGGSAFPDLDPSETLRQVEATLRPLREGLFAEASPHSADLMNTFLFATLSGMAEQQRYSVVDDANIKDQLATLCDSLVRLARGRVRRSDSE